METQPVPLQESRRAIPSWLRPFARITTSGNYIAEIDGLRFITMAAIAFFHLYGTMLSHGAGRYGAPEPWLAAFDRELPYSVPMFFMISGFVLAVPFASHHMFGKKPVSLRNYYLRRLSRLEPPYFVNLILIYLLLVVAKHADARALFPHLLASMVYQHGTIYGQMSSVNGVAYSLEIEIQFYAVMPLLAGVFAIRSKWLRRGLMAAAMIAVGAIQTWLIEPGDRVTLSIVFFFQYFLAGFLLADVYLVEWSRVSQRSHTFVWDLYGVLGLTTMFSCAHFDCVPRIVFPFAALVFYCSLFRSRVLHAIFTTPVLTTIGGMCYTIYLFHYTVISALYRLTGPLTIGHTFWVNAALQYAIAAPVILGVSGVFYLALEKPCMNPNWPKQLAAWFRQLARGGVEKDVAGEAPPGG